MRLVRYEYIRATESYIVDIDEEYCARLVEWLKQRGECELEFDESKITPNYVLACFDDDSMAAEIYQVSGMAKGWNDKFYPITLTSLIYDYVDEDLRESYHDTVDREWIDSDTVVEDAVSADGCTRMSDVPVWAYLEEHK